MPQDQRQDHEPLGEELLGRAAKDEGDASFHRGEERDEADVATLIWVSERWSRVSVSELERQQLKLPRKELRIDPPPDEEVRQGRGAK